MATLEEAELAHKRQIQIMELLEREGIPPDPVTVAALISVAAQVYVTHNGQREAWLKGCGGMYDNALKMERNTDTVATQLT